MRNGSKSLRINALPKSPSSILMSRKQAYAAPQCDMRVTEQRPTSDCNRDRNHGSPKPYPTPGGTLGPCRGGSNAYRCLGQEERFLGVNHLGRSPEDSLLGSPLM